MNEGIKMTDPTKTRVLLALWALGGAKEEVKRGDFTKRIVSKGKKVADFQEIFDELEKENAIAISTKKVSLVSPRGLELLAEGLKSSDFNFEGTIVGTWAANALLRWIAQMDTNANSAPITQKQPAANGKSSNEAIASYEKFEKITLEVFDKLNRDYNLDNLVPIYKIRKEIGEKVSRENFNEWMLEMQEKDILQLMAGEMPDMTPDKREDSITIPGAGLRYYAKQLS
ncbi:MAG: hypothetical protein WBF90_19030 [Rivularia sp. (in: cyanobacteria)]